MMMKTEERNKVNAGQLNNVKKNREDKEYDKKVQLFLEQMAKNEKSQKSARYYLSQNGWDVEKAIREYRQDLQWE